MNYKITQMKRWIRMLTRMGISLHECGVSEETIFKMYDLLAKDAAELIFRDL